MRRGSRLLGAVLAGGASRRFGSDKALATLDGKPLIVHVFDALRPQVEALVVVGREYPEIVAIADAPRPGLGPIGGLAAVLSHAETTGYDAVLTAGCDLPDIPLDLVARLGAGPAVARGQPLLGVWPVTLAAAILAWVETSGDLSLRRVVKHFAVREVDIGPLANVNTAADLLEFAAVTTRAR